ncbi:MAG: O-antigen ligase family protein [Bacteroidales bacterium]|nr:O-antigen ligase family protein [Bacteroidales bacterium]
MLGKAGSTSAYFFRTFLLWTFPAYLAGIYIFKRNNIQVLIKLLDPFIILFTLYIIRNAIFFLGGNWSVYTATGTTYQQVSYVGAFTFGLNLLMIINAREYERFKLFRGNTYQFISYCMLTIQAGMVFIAGGRGAFIELIALVVLLLLPSLFHHRKRGHFWSLVLIIVAGLLIFQLLDDNSALVSGISRLKRIFSISELADESRYTLYANAFNYIKENFILGYGIFGQYEVIGRNVHNIFLEILLGSGIIGLLLFSLLFLGALRKHIFFRKIDITHRFFDVLLISALVNLMFSGTWIASNQLWFYLGYFIPSSYSSLKQLHKSKNNTYTSLVEINDSNRKHTIKPDGEVNNG